MVVRTPKKVKACRGNRSHGGGHKKKRRGAGHRGGRGRAGLHKHKYVYALKHGLVKGSKGARSLYGFSPKNVSPVIAINVGRLEEIAAGMELKGKELDLAELKIDKLLGGGRVTRPLIVKVDACSEKAKAKIEAAGGKVEVPEEGSTEAEAPEASKEAPKKVSKEAPPEAPEKQEQAKEALAEREKSNKDA